MNVRSQIYVDKSGSLEELNRLIDTQQRFVCVTRPRRFGKSMAADMLSAYYGCKKDTSALFDGLKIGKMDSYKAHLNQYNVLKINMQEFLSATDSVDEMLAMLKRYIVSPANETKATESEMNIPDYAIERLARTMLPLIQKYYESDEGRKELILWQENHK